MEAVFKFLIWSAKKAHPPTELPSKFACQLHQPAKFYLSNIDPSLLKMKARDRWTFADTITRLVRMDCLNL